MPTPPDTIIVVSDVTVYIFGSNTMFHSGDEIAITSPYYIPLLRSGYATDSGHIGAGDPEMPAYREVIVYSVEEPDDDTVLVYNAAAGAYIPVPIFAAQLMIWGSSPDLMAVGAITRGTTLGESGGATAFDVIWPPDGATGSFVGVESTVAPGTIDSYTVTHILDAVTTTYTQPTVTRDATSGAVTFRPAIVVT
jgi:hypothetical protein